MMTDNNLALTTFLSDVKPTQTLWALQDKESEDWVILDSINFENTDVMPLWSQAELARQHCCEEWKDYIPVQISVADWLEFWLEDLNEDGVIIGVNWLEDDYLEMELAEFTQSIASIEKLS